MKSPETPKGNGLGKALEKIAAGDSADLANIHKWQNRVKFSQAMVDHRRSVHYFTDFFYCSGQLAGAPLVHVRLLSFYGLTFLKSPVSDEDVEKIVLAAAEKVLEEKYPACLEAYQTEKEGAKKNVAVVAAKITGKVEVVTGQRQPVAWRSRYFMDKRK